MQYNLNVVDGRCGLLLEESQSRVWYQEGEVVPGLFETVDVDGLLRFFFLGLGVRIPVIN